MGKNIHITGMELDEKDTENSSVARNLKGKEGIPR